MRPTAAPKSRQVVGAGEGHRADRESVVALDAAYGGGRRDAQDEHRHAASEADDYDAGRYATDDQHPHLLEDVPSPVVGRGVCCRNQFRIHHAYGRTLAGMGDTDLLTRVTHGAARLVCTYVKPASKLRAKLQRMGA